ncbi:ATP-dependent DNA helicase RecQ [Oxalobacteraceae bacterium GrIS 1.11]
MVTRPEAGDTTRAAKRGAAVRARQIDQLLRTVFGVERLRDGQQQVIDSVLEGRDTLALMPGGGSNSLCYQIPASILPGATIVVSPLQAQSEQLGNAAWPNGQEHAAPAGIPHRFSDIVFCTPERLSSPDFLALLAHTPVGLLVIDDAHCISRRGDDFRPAYRELGAAIDALGRPTILALTATSTEEVLVDIGQQLGAPRMRVVNTSIYRPNLRYRVVQASNKVEQYAAALLLVRDSKGSGIVYTATVKAAEQLYRQLRAAGESVACYHGKLAAHVRQENQDLFMTGQRRVMVATNAFAMGPGDTRFLIHLHMPANLETYCQESGRAGGDGLPAECTLLCFPDDKRLQPCFLAENYPVAEELRAVFAAAGELSRGRVSFSFAEIKDGLPGIAEGKLKICLALLKDGRLLRQNRKLAYQVRAGAPSAATFGLLAQVYRQQQERERVALEHMLVYAQSGRCRWKYLLDYFGDQADFQRCRHCDNCLSAQRAMAASEAAPPRSPSITVGNRVKASSLDMITKLLTIAFPEIGARTAETPALNRAGEMACHLDGP